jgi:hypothetical protein
LDVNFVQKPKILRFIRENRKLIFALVLPVYLFIVHSSITNRHSHFCANGMVITHSHPFDHHETGAAKYNHTQKEICFYAGLNSDFYPAEPETLVQGFWSFRLFSKQSGDYVYPENQLTHQFWLRGPPASYSC